MLLSSLSSMSVVLLLMTKTVDDLQGHLWGLRTPSALRSTSSTDKIPFRVVSELKFEHLILLCPSARHSRGFPSTRTHVAPKQQIGRSNRRLKTLTRSSPSTTSTRHAAHVGEMFMFILERTLPEELSAPSLLLADNVAETLAATELRTTNLLITKNAV